jgi:hypothetical protein
VDRFNPGAKGLSAPCFRYGLGIAGLDMIGTRSCAFENCGGPMLWQHVVTTDMDGVGIIMSVISLTNSRNI